MVSTETIQIRGKDLIMISFSFSIFLCFDWLPRKMEEDKEKFLSYILCRFGFLKNEKALKLRYCIRFSFVETFLLEPKF